MIANEMHRAGKLTSGPDSDRRRASYERVLNLTDLTILVRQERSDNGREIFHIVRRREYRCEVR